MTLNVRIIGHIVEYIFILSQIRFIRRQSPPRYRSNSPPQYGIPFDAPVTNDPGCLYFEYFDFYFEFDFGWIIL